MAAREDVNNVDRTTRTTLVAVFKQAASGGSVIANDDEIDKFATTLVHLISMVPGVKFTLTPAEISSVFKTAFQRVLAEPDNVEEIVDDMLNGMFQFTMSADFTIPDK